MGPADDIACSAGLRPDLDSRATDHRQGWQPDAARSPGRSGPLDHLLGQQQQDPARSATARRFSTSRPVRPLRPGVHLRRCGRHLLGALARPRAPRQRQAQQRRLRRRHQRPGLVTANRAGRDDSPQPGPGRHDRARRADRWTSGWARGAAPEAKIRPTRSPKASYQSIKRTARNAMYSDGIWAPPRRTSPDDP